MRAVGSILHNANRPVEVYKEASRAFLNLTVAMRGEVPTGYTSRMRYTESRLARATHPFATVVDVAVLRCLPRLMHATGYVGTRGRGSGLLAQLGSEPAKLDALSRLRGALRGDTICDGDGGRAPPGADRRTPCQQHPSRQPRQPLP
jgi:hypothetical protein